MILLSEVPKASGKANMTRYLIKSWKMVSCLKHLFYRSKLTRPPGEGTGRFIQKITLMVFMQENELLMGGTNCY